MNKTSYGSNFVINDFSNHYKHYLEQTNQTHPGNLGYTLTFTQIKTILL